MWEGEFDTIVSKKDKLQDLNFNQLKLDVYDTFKKDEEITTDSEPTDNSDVINKLYLDEKIKKRGSCFVYRKRLQRIQIKIQQTISGRNFNSKRCENDYSNFI